MYVRILGAFYLRLTGSVTDVYQYLEPLYNDYRKLRVKLSDGRFSLTHVDEVIDQLLKTDYSCDIALPRIQKRWTLEASGILESRRSALEDDFEEEEEKEDEEQAKDVDANTHEKDYYRGRSPTRERDRDRKRDNFKYRERDYDKDRDYDRDYGRGRERDWERERDRDRERDRHRPRDEKDHGRERDREREREGRERDRRDRDRGKRRSRSRSRSRSRDRRERDREDGDHRRRRARGSLSPRRHPVDDGNFQDEPKKKKEKVKKSDGTDHPDPEIAEANRLRASLGLAPLKL